MKKFYKKQIATKMYPISNLMITPKVSMQACNQAINQSMNLGAYVDYAHALMQIQQGNPLVESDLELFDHVDKVTMKHFGICLKDSKVTKARVEACKRYGMEFIDLGGLIDHMNMVNNKDESHAYSY
jgi:hypothetical protein